MTKSTRENVEERRARCMLQNDGFQVERIREEPNERRADYRVTSGAEETIVEVTGKEETHFLLGLLARARVAGFAGRGREVRHWNAMDKVLKRKAAQLQQTPGSAEWIVASIEPHVLRKAF